MPKISFILATVDRTTELERCLHSLGAQIDKRFELLVVDQNVDGRLDSLLRKHASSLHITHVKITQRGLSHARNAGLSLIASDTDIVTFADDDGWYPQQLVGDVIEWFEGNPSYSGLSGCCLDEQGNESQVLWPEKGNDIDWFRAWSEVTSISLFLQRQVVERVGKFDEALGVGAETPWGAAEEVDYVLRTLKQGFTLRYEPTIVVHHPPAVLAFDARSWRRARLYGGGMGRVIKKHRLPHWFFMRSLIRAFCGFMLGILSANTGMAKFHINVLAGRWNGWHSIK